MANNDLLQTLAGCRFHQDYLRTQEAPQAAPRPPPTPQTPGSIRRCPKRRRINRVFRKYCLAMAGLFAGSALLIVLPLWLVSVPYGKACLLSLPPALLCALTWAAGAWWAWDKERHLFVAVTLGASPVRMMLVLGWAWVVLTLVEVPFTVFVVSLMWHWTLFTVTEIAMLLELQPKQPACAAVRLQTIEQQADGGARLVVPPPNLIRGPPGAQAGRPPCPFPRAPRRPAPRAF